MKDIMLKITGRQINRKDEREDDTVEFMTEGKLYKRAGSTFIVYEESEVSGMEGVKTTLRIDDASGSVRMKRFGKGLMMDTVMEFSKGQRFSSLYDTPIGAIPMEVLTNSIVNQLDPEKGRGRLFIDYEISLKGLAEMRSLLDIEVAPAPLMN